MATALQIEGTSTPAFAARHFTPAELGQLWGLSADTVRRLFLHEPGVLIVSDGVFRKKRRYRTLRIPAAVAERVHHRLTRGVT